MAEKTKLITQLRDAKNLIEQLEQDKVKQQNLQY